MISSVRADAFVPSGGKSARVVVRKAAMRDIAPILNLINGYAARGIMLARPGAGRRKRGSLQFPSNKK